MNTKLLSSPSILISLTIFVLIIRYASGADHTQDSLDKVRELVAAKKAILVDVREKIEWDAGHIKGAKWVPMSTLKMKLTDEQLYKLLPKDKLVYLYCAGGIRCLDVAEMLGDRKLELKALKQGYQTLLKGGFENELPEPDKPVVPTSK